jgi:fructose-1,6-bisphosphatase/inositol monophosphatase family enzyme
MVSSNYLIKTSRKASKLLNRDFCELEKMQQSSGALISSFVEKSLERTHDILIDEISKIRNVYFSDEEFYNDGAFEKKESFLMIDMIDSIYNFSRSIPATEKVSLVDSVGDCNFCSIILESGS